MEKSNLPETFGFKKKRRIQNFRGSSVSSSIIEKDSEVSAVVRPQRPSKFKATEKSQIKNSDSCSSDEEPLPKKSGLSVNYRSNEKQEIDRGAQVSEIDTAQDQDAQAIFERKINLNKDREGKPDDNIYRGLSGYRDYLPKQDTIQGKASSNLVRQGPYRAASNIRVTTRWDYQPDLCKDYKDTGFCGFGDSCKFVHDRTDYKAGWELERDYEAGLLSKAQENFKVECKPEEEAPTICGICEDPFKSPVRTKCGHYFCGKCALSKFKDNSMCATCGSETHGIFIYQKKKSTQIIQPPSEGQRIINEIITSGSETSIESSQSD